MKDAHHKRLTQGDRGNYHKTPRGYDFSRERLKQEAAQEIRAADDIAHEDEHHEDLLRYDDYDDILSEFFYGTSQDYEIDRRPRWQHLSPF